MQPTLSFHQNSNSLSLYFEGDITLYTIKQLEKKISQQSMSTLESIEINLEKVSFIDTAAAIFLVKMQKKMSSEVTKVQLIADDEKLLSTLKLVQTQSNITSVEKETQTLKDSFLKKKIVSIGKYVSGIFGFITFLGQLFVAQLRYFSSLENIRFKEIAYEINESAVKALGIVALTSFLIGLVVAYQSAFQLKTYGANIFIVDMLGISILRELAPLITAIVIAGRSGSAFTAQIGAMKITQELDAMKTMGFDPFAFLVLPRIIALMIAMPLLIFVADCMGILGGMIVSHVNLHITPGLFLDRFHEVVDIKHFFIGIIKGPFFAFLIATIGIYRGLVVKDDTQSIGFNTTKSVVESIFAVIVCDALFSIILTNLGI